MANRYSWILQILQNYRNIISLRIDNTEFHSYIYSIFSFAMLLKRIVKVQVPKWKFRIFPGIVLVHVILMRFVIGDLLAREIILRKLRRRNSTPAWFYSLPRERTFNEWAAC